MYKFKCIEDFTILDKVIIKKDEVIEFEEFYEKSYDLGSIKFTSEQLSKMSMFEEIKTIEVKHFLNEIDIDDLCIIKHHINTNIGLKCGAGRQIKFVISPKVRATYNITFEYKKIGLFWFLSNKLNQSYNSAR